MGFWFNKFLVIGTSIFVNFVIAKYLSDGTSSFWLIFLILSLSPMFFTIKNIIINYFVFFLLRKDKYKNELLLKFKQESWPLPLMTYKDGMDYLIDVTIDPNVSPEIKVSAARLHGNLENQFQSMQLLSAFFSNKALTKAVNAYDNTTSSD